MTTFKSIAAMSVLASGAMMTAASAMPAAGTPGFARPRVEQVRIICEPFGRCFRIDPFGRRIFVPRPDGFERPGLGFGLGRGGFDERNGERRRREPGFDERDGDRNGAARRPRQDQDGLQQRQPQGGAQQQGGAKQQGNGQRQGQGQGQGAGQQQGNGQNGQRQQRQRQPNDGDQ